MFADCVKPRAPNKTVLGDAKLLNAAVPNESPESAEPVEPNELGVELANEDAEPVHAPKTVEEAAEPVLAPKTVEEAAPSFSLQSSQRNSSCDLWR